MSASSALIGAIVFAWMPENENLDLPGSKFRPVLIVGQSQDRRLVHVVYGTSQRVDREGSGEIVLDCTEVPGLSKPTKFCFRKSCWIPLKDSYFSASEGNRRLVVVGHLPANRAADVLDRLLEANPESR